MSLNSKLDTFNWDNLGNISLGRPNLGDMTYVLVYRLMQFTMKNVIENKYGTKEANLIFFEAGKLAGEEYCKNMIDLNVDWNSFIAQLHKTLSDLKIGIMHMEDMDIENMKFVLTISEDLDCSGLPILGQNVCEYDEGFISGILNVYSKREFEVTEIDCWANGGRTCRFLAVVKE